jgi:hypothetical protein
LAVKIIVENEDQYAVNVYIYRRRFEYFENATDSLVGQPPPNPIVIKINNLVMTTSRGKHSYVQESTTKSRKQGICTVATAISYIMSDRDITVLSLSASCMAFSKAAIQECNSSSSSH